MKTHCIDILIYVSYIFASFGVCRIVHYIPVLIYDSRCTGGCRLVLDFQITCDTINGNVPLSVRMITKSTQYSDILRE